MISELSATLVRNGVKYRDGGIALVAHKSLDTLQNNIRIFAQKRDWGQFHSPKNLSMALTVEAAELMEIFQWMKEDESRNLSDDHRQRVMEEIADILIYLIRLADVLDVNLIEVAERKLQLNQLKYPAERVRGKSLKYSEYENE